MENKRFITFAKRNYIGNALYELYVLGIIHGLQIALCDEDLQHSLDCEMFSNHVMFVTNTSQEKYDAFCKMVETICPGVCEFDKGES